MEWAQLTQVGFRLANNFSYRCVLLLHAIVALKNLLRFVPAIHGKTLARFFALRNCVVSPT